MDPRFENAVSMIRSGVFGWGDYFEPVLDSLSGSNDYYLLANDFPSYLEAQVAPCSRTRLCPLHTPLRTIGKFVGSLEPAKFALLRGTGCSV